jgi:sigma-B regulation protein RsbU (phosphoserine phosphatase)
MFEGTHLFFSKLIGTLAVILVISAFAGSTDLLNRFIDQKRNWKYDLMIGVLGGLFGIYGNISGVDFNGAVISVRDIGPMISGFLGGPIGGVLAGVIAGVHRLTMGGVTAQACVVATCAIGLCCGLLGRFLPEFIKKPQWSFLIGAAMELLHLGIVLLMVRPFETAWGIVKQIALPFVLVNAVGLTLMISIIAYMEKQRRLTLERNRLHSELDIANVIQHSLLPTIDETYPGRSELDVAGSMEAAKEVGGDFYDIFFLDSDRITFLIGDVSGKGVPAALFMASAKIILQNCIRDMPSLSAAVETANNVLCKRNEADMFVTVWVGVLNLRTGALTYVSAGHNPPVLLHDGTAAFLPAKNGFVLAGMEGARYKENEIQLQTGDALFLYTDGVTEATAASEELFGESRLLSALQRTGDGSAQHVLDVVKNAVDTFVQKNDPFDDITMLCFRWRQTAEG